jgi:peptidoglycan hydrolase-like protein with peptidoglycan-binding domain
VSLDVRTLVDRDGHAHDITAGAPARIRARRRRLPAIVSVLVVAALVSAAVGLFVRSRDDGGETTKGADEDRPATSTVAVTKKDLEARTEVDGTLGYSGSRGVLNQLRGTITALPKEGTVIERGQSLYSVDQRPVPLLYGEVPAWRTMTAGIGDGVDIRQLEANLVALGHATETELAVDETFTSATTAAVKRWQKAMGVEQTGSVELGQAVFLPDAVRVAGVKAEIGAPAPPGGPVFTATGTSRVVQIDLDATRQALAKVGDKVDVKLPGGTTTKGTISAVGSVAQSKGQGDNAKQVVSVTVTLDEPKATGTLDQAPVKVGIVTDSRKGVLAVPVNALLALVEGGYGVRLEDGRIVPVKLGLFSRGNVEISGEGIAEGTQVEVPAT